MVQAGEKLYQAAERESFEELGIELDLANTPSRMTVRFQEGWNEIYTVEKEVDSDQLRLQASEVSEVRWVTETEYLQLLSEKQFIPYLYATTIFDYFRHESEYLT